MWYVRQEIETLSRVLGSNDPRVMGLNRLVSRNPGKAWDVLRALQAMGLRRGIDLTNLPSFPVSDAAVCGNTGIHLGTVMEGDRPVQEAWVPLDEIRASHMLITGTTGCGKSTLLRYLASQLITLGHRCVFFDSESEHWRLVDQLGTDIVWYLDPFSDRDNPFEPPPGVNSDKWSAALMAPFRQDFYMRDSMTSMLRWGLKKLYKERRTDEDGLPPTIRDLISLYDNLSYKPGTRQGESLSSLRERLHLMLDGLSQMGTCRKGIPYDKPAKRTIVYDTGALSQQMRLAFTNLKLLKNLLYREAQIEATGRQPSANEIEFCFIEEAHRSLAASIGKRQDLGEPFLFDFTRSCRKRGIRLAFVEQVPATIPPQLWGNIGLRLIGGVPEGKSLWVLEQATGFDDAQLKTIRTLGDRTFVLQTPRFARDGVVIRLPDLGSENEPQAN